MPPYRVKYGKLGRLEDGTLKVYKTGDTIDLPAHSARALGAQVAPATRAAALADLDETMPATSAEAPRPARPRKRGA